MRRYPYDACMCVTLICSQTLGYFFKWKIRHCQGICALWAGAMGLRYAGELVTTIGWTGHYIYHACTGGGENQKISIGVAVVSLQVSHCCIRHTHVCMFMSLYRYIPYGLLEVAQKLNERPPYFVCRDDLETLMASKNCKDWIKIRWA